MAKSLASYVTINRALSAVFATFVFAGLLAAAVTFVFSPGDEPEPFMYPAGAEAIKLIATEKSAPVVKDAGIAAVKMLVDDEAPGILGAGIHGVYLADFLTEDDALASWRYYRGHIPVLNFFQPFAVSKTEPDNSDAVSLVALAWRVDLPGTAAQEVVADTCRTLLQRQYPCTPVKFSLNMQEMEALGQPLIAQALAPPRQFTGNPVLNERPLTAHDLTTVMPAAGTPGSDPFTRPDDWALDEEALADLPEQSPADDTVMQAAMRAAYEVVRNRYTGAVFQAQDGGGEAVIADGEALALTQDALTSAAERAFEKFMQERFGSRDLEDRDYSSMRNYFIAAFQHAASASIKSIGRQFVHDVTAGGNFHAMNVRSELLDQIDENVANALIDTGLAAAKTSKYAFLRNLEVSYKIRENSKPEYSILTVQPIHSSKGRRHNIFAQAAAFHEVPRYGFSGGLGYRFMPFSQKYLLGTNLFVDYEYPYDHLRASVGVDYKTSLYGVTANYYKGLTDWKDSRTGFQEKALDGYDVEVSGRLPILPALEFFGKSYRWNALDGENDIRGREARVEYTPIPALTFEALANDENGRDLEYGLGVRFNYKFGAPAEYLYDWDEQFREKPVPELIFSKVYRENRIRVQERVDPDAAAGSTAPGPAFLAGTPAAGATGISIGTDVSIQFDTDVQAGTGNIVFTDTNDGSGDFTIPVGDARVSFAADTMTIDLSAQLLEFLTDYEVTLAAGVVEDTSGKPGEPVNAGDYPFRTVVDPTATFGAADQTMAPGATGVTTINRFLLASWQTTIDVGAAPDGVIFECGGTGIGIAAWFFGGNFQLAAGDGTTTTTTGDTIFVTYPVASIPQGLHHFVMVAEPAAPAEMAIYMDGIKVASQAIAGNMDGTSWSGGNDCGYGLVGGGSIRAGGNSNALSDATLQNNLSFYENDAPLDF